MEIEQIRELIGLMKENDLTEVRILEGEKKVLLKRGHDVPNAPIYVSQMPQAAPPITASQPALQSSAQPAAEHVATINSPMVGTFYASPSPDSEPYVRSGDKVNPDTVVCIVEAMKVMNEIKAEVSGTIEKVLAKNGQAVEFGQSLFQIKPD
jgi:acetyl-CoA carboxylase biotin carboxyl carrier protein